MCYLGHKPSEEETAVANRSQTPRIFCKSHSYKESVAGQPSLTAFRVIVTTFNLLIRVHQHDFKSNVFLLVVCFVLAPRIFVWSGLGRPEAMWFIKTFSYSISATIIVFILNRIMSDFFCRPQGKEMGLRASEY